MSINNHNQYLPTKYFMRYAVQCLPHGTPLEIRPFSEEDFVRDNEEDLLQLLMADNHIKIYGSAAEFAQNLANLQQFSSFHSWRFLPMCIPYCRDPNILETLDGERVNPIGRACMAFYLKSIAMSDKNWHKFIQVEHLDSLKMIVDLWKQEVHKNPIPSAFEQFIDGNHQCFMLPKEIHGNFIEIKSLLDESDNIRNQKGVLINVPMTRTKFFCAPILAPNGKFYKLAVDGLDELLKSLVFGERIFQKMKDWKDIEFLFDTLKPVFDSGRKMPYLLPNDMITSILQNTSNFLSPYSKNPVKPMRAFKSKTLTTKNLKKELMFLEIPNLLPDVCDFASEAAEYSRKRGQTDVAVAIVHCVFRCLCQKFPYLDEFWYIQKYSEIDEESAKDRGAPSFKNTSWRDIDFDKVQVIRVSDKINDYKLLCSGRALRDNGQMTIEALANAKMFFGTLEEHLLELDEVSSKAWENIANVKHSLKQQEKNMTTKVFLVDVEVSRSARNKNVADVPAHDVINSIGQTTFFETIESFSASSFFSEIFQAVKFQNFYNYKNRIYLRTFSTSAYCRDETRRVFTQELLDIIPILLKQQGSSLNKSKLASYQAHLGDETLLLHGVSQILEDFNINKELITLVPDIGYTVTKKQMCVDSGCPTVQFLTPNRQPAMTVSMAHFHIFQSVACDMSWKTIDASLMKAIIDEMKDLNHEEYVLVCRVEKSIEMLKRHPNYLETKEKHLLTPLIKLYDADFNDSVSLRFVLSELQEHGIETSKFSEEVMKRLENHEIPAWEARVLFLLIWMDLFFNGNEQGLMNSVIAGWMHRVPILVWERKDDVAHVLSRRNDKFVNYWKRLACEHLDDLANSTRYPERHAWLKDSDYKKYIIRAKTSNLMFRQEFPDDYKQLVEVIKEKTMSSNEVRSEPVINLLLHDIIVPFRIGKMVDKLMSEEDYKFYGTYDDAERYRKFEKAVRYMMEEEDDVPEFPESSECQNLDSTSSKVKEKLPETSEDSHAAFAKPSEEIPEALEASEDLTTSTKKKKKKKKNKNKKQGSQESDSPESDGIAEKLEKANVAGGPENDGGPENVNECTKCKRIGDVCEKTKKELKTSKNKNSTLQAKLSASEKRLREMTEERDLQTGLHKASQARVQALEAELESLRQSSEASISQLTRKVADLEKLSDDKDEAIRGLKAHVPPETVVDVRLLADCREALIDLQNQQDVIKSHDENGMKIADKLYLKLWNLTKDTKIRGKANWYLVDFKEKYSEYENAVERNIKYIQKSLVITRAELPITPVKPEIPVFFQEEIDKALEALRIQEHEKVAQQVKDPEPEICQLCMVNKLTDEAFECPECKNQYCNPCIEKWWLRNKSCPSCRDKWN